MDLKEKPALIRRRRRDTCNALRRRAQLVPLHSGIELCGREKAIHLCDDWLNDSPWRARL